MNGFRETVTYVLGSVGIRANAFNLIHIATLA